MSGEGAVGFAVFGVVAAGVVVGVGAARVGALVASRAVDLVGAGLIQVGEHAERSRAQWEAAHADQLVWEAAARQVIDANARLTVLRAQPDLDADLSAALPGSLQPCAHSPEELLNWCAAAAQAVQQVEHQLHERASRSVLAVLRRSAAEQRAVTAEEALARYRTQLAARTHDAQEAPRAVAAAASIVSRLPTDALAADRAAVLAAAAQVAADRRDVDHDLRLDELRLRVQRASARAATHREDALAAAVLLQALDGGSGPELPGVRAALMDVVERRRRLDPMLRTDAERMVSGVRVRLEREYVRRSVADTLAELGYEVEEGFATVSSAVDRLRLAHPDWAEHAVQIAIDDDEVRAVVVRSIAQAGTDAERADQEREEQWCGDLEKLRAVLGDSGVRVVDRRLVPPGERPALPVLARRGDRGVVEAAQARPRPS